MNTVIKNIFSQDFYSKMVSLPENNYEKLSSLIEQEGLVETTFETVIQSFVANQLNISTGTHKTVLQYIKEKMFPQETYEQFLVRIGENDFYQKHYYQNFKDELVQSIIIELAFLFNPQNTFEENQDIFDKCVKQKIIGSLKCEMCGIKILPLLKKGADGLICVTPSNEIQEITINVPTGRLFCADWFRDSDNTLDKHIKDVTNPQLQKVKKDFSYEVEHGNSPLNEYFQVASAADKDIATIFVGNSSPQIFQNNNKLSFNSYSEDTPPDEEYKDVGYVCTDLWRVTVADKQTLAEILQKKYTKEEADEILTQWENESSIVSVKPGRYKLTFTHIKRQINQDKNQFFTLEKIEN